MDKNNDRWVEERLATLTPDSEWQPNVRNGLAKLRERANGTARVWNWAWAIVATIAACLCLIALPASRMSARRVWESLFSNKEATQLSAGRLDFPISKGNREPPGKAGKNEEQQYSAASGEASVAGHSETRPNDSRQTTPRIEYIPSEVVANYLNVGLMMDVGELITVPVPQRPVIRANTGGGPSSTSIQIAPKLAPPPYDPFEPVTTRPKTLRTPEARYAAISLMRRALYSQEFFAPIFEPPFTHAEPGFPYTVKVSFAAGAQMQDRGIGEMEETRNLEGVRRWTGHIDGFTLTRIIPESGRFYDQGSRGPMPIRLQMVQSIVLGNLETLPDFTTDSIRTANATVHGIALTCILTSISATEAPGRDWSEKEYCIEPRSEQLQLYSAAPGIYVAYDYGASAPFHDHVVPDQFTASEAGRVVLNGTIKVEDPETSSLDPAGFTPTEQMVKGGVNLSSPSAALYVIQFRATTATSSVLQPVIVHATLSPDGNVVEAETLQASDRVLSQSALELVKKTKYAIPRQWHTFSDQPPQGELFATVQ